MAEPAYTIVLKSDALTRAAAVAPAILYKHLRVEFHKIMHGFNALHVKTRMSGRPGVASRSGALRGKGPMSMRPVVTGDTLADLRGIYGSDSPYAATQEYGDPNKRPTKKQFLAIPLDAAKTPTGVSRFSSPLLESQLLKSAYPQTFVARSKAGNLIIFGKLAPGASGPGSIVPLFVLKRSVSIPARLGTRALWRENIDSVALDISIAAQAALDEAAKVSGGS